VVIPERRPLRIVFCGTPDFAVPSLLQLNSQPDFQIVTVVTQPDRPKGRGQATGESPIKSVARDIAVPLWQPARIRAPGNEQRLLELAPDAIVIIAYGQIIPASLLGIPRLGWINLHASLLPKYRGAAPIHWAIAHGETKTGVTTMRIDAGMDTGEILLERETPIGPTENAVELAKRLSELGAPLISETLLELDGGRIRPRPQNHEQASYAPMLRREDGRISWHLPATEIYDRMRGFAPWPGAFTGFRGKTCHLSGVPVSNHADEKSARTEPGTLCWDGRELLVCCGGRSWLQIRSVKLEGRKEISAQDFANGAHLVPGERFGQPG
jgi:methionyl-tRNA formyltransferase